MQDLLKAMFIPIVGCIAIGAMFLAVTFGGHWEDRIDNEEGKYGLATVDIPFATDDVITFTGECDGSTYRPVCGADGETYDNACFAVREGSSVVHLGQCGARTS